MGKLFDRKKATKDLDKAALGSKAAAALCQIGVTYCNTLTKMFSNKKTREALLNSTENICDVLEQEYVKFSMVIQEELMEDVKNIMRDVKAFRQADRDAARGPQPKTKKAKPQYNEDETEFAKAPSEDDIKGMFSNIFQFKKRDHEEE